MLPTQLDLFAPEPVYTVRSQAPDDPTSIRLATHLQVAVPLQLIAWQQQGMPSPHRLRGLAQVIMEHGDHLLYGGMHTHEALQALVEGVAYAAVQSGGITIFGQHFDAHVPPPQKGAP